MYSLMIVDDEEPVLKSFSFIVENNDTRFQLAGVARSGIEAIKICPQLKPDLIIMDIAMPGLDGLQTIGRIRQDYPEIQFILSSAYERFDIAQKAIPLGVFQYLVKPVSKKMLLETLDRVFEHLEQRRHKTDIDLEEFQLSSAMVDTHRKEFFHQIAGDSLTSESWERFKKQLSIPFPTGFIGILDVPGNSQSRKEGFETIQQRLVKKLPCITMDVGRFIVFVSCRMPCGPVVEVIHTEINTVFNSGWTFCTGEISEGPQLSRSYNQAVQKVWEKGRGKTKDLSTQTRLRASFRSSGLGFTQKGELVSEVVDYWISLYHGYSFSEAKMKLCALFVLIIDPIPDPGAILPDPTADLADIESSDEVVFWIHASIHCILEFLNTFSPGTLPGPLQTALGIIRTRFTEPLQLSTLAEQCKISPSYLSTLFSEHLHTNFTDYLNTLRMNEAERLLNKSGKSVKEVAFSVGFLDPNYFSRAFKKYRGYSPTELPSRRNHETEE